jgi:Protein of unknown function (DUF2934)
MSNEILELSGPEQAGRAACLPDANTTNPDVEAAWRNRMIREAAYFRSQHRNPCCGKELEDWLAAEKEVGEFLQHPAS